jgi:2-keto-4-pentenoate hydratase/2-oxohepta-3-ene-1,7-dioic acid hydratase in catechol pathway
MRWIKFSAAGRTAYGLVEGERIIEVAGDPFNGYERTAKSHALAGVKIEVPLIPRTFYCAGLNYTSHIKEHGDKTGASPTSDSPISAIAPSMPGRATAGRHPRDATGAIPGELVAVIGTKAKHLSERDALSCVLGYTIGNDVSERTWQASDRTLWRGKNTDTFKPMGPWIETAVDLDKLETIVRVNGTVTTRFPTNDMLFGVATYIAAMTRYLTLHPGDVIWMGTDGTSPNLKAGDVVEVEITGIGTLRNPFVAESA